MLSIRSFSELTNHLQQLKSKKRLVVVNPADSNTMKAIIKASKLGIIDPILLGDPSILDLKNLSEYNNIQIIPENDLTQACALAVKLVKEGDADILMKGMVNTDILLHAVLNKEKGLVPYGNVVTFYAVMDIPHYPKLLFVTDPAVIPSPNVRQRIAMIHYGIKLSSSFGIKKPKIALIHGTEKMNFKLNYMKDYQKIMDLSCDGEFGNAVVSGPLDVFLALDKRLGQIKDVETPILGDADILIFPDFDAANVFYKSMISFAYAQMGGLMFGTEKPIVLTSRSDSAISKFNSIALACVS